MADRMDDDALNALLSFLRDPSSHGPDATRLHLIGRAADAIEQLIKERDEANAKVAECHKALARTDAEHNDLASKTFALEARVADLTSQFDAAKEALKEAAELMDTLPAEKPDDRRHGIYDLPDGSRWNSETGEVVPAEKPEAVETGEPVAWREKADDLVKRLREEARDLHRAAWARTDGGQGVTLSAMLAEEAADLIEALYAASPAPTPPAQDDARKRALEEAAELCETLADWSAVSVADRIRELCSSSEGGAK